MNISKPKKVVITGGFGFIGKLLTRHLINLNIQVIVVEHPNAVIPDSFDNIEIFRVDLTDYEEVKKSR